MMMMMMMMKVMSMILVVDEDVVSSGVGDEGHDEDDDVYGIIFVNVSMMMLKLTVYILMMLTVQKGDVIIPNMCKKRCCR